MASAKADQVKSAKAGRKPQDKRPDPSAPVGSGRRENKVSYEDENIEHTIRRAVREKNEKRKKNPGLYL